jgi:flagellar biosynthesis GTPase FlhF
MAIRLATLPIQEALEEAGIQNCGDLPQIMRIGDGALVLSEKRDCYFTATMHDCSCNESISGIFPCLHQSKAFTKEAENEGWREKAKLANEALFRKSSEEETENELHRKRLEEQIRQKRLKEEQIRLAAEKRLKALREIAQEKLAQQKKNEERLAEYEMQAKENLKIKKLEEEERYERYARGREKLKSIEELDFTQGYESRLEKKGNDRQIRDD